MISSCYNAGTNFTDMELTKEHFDKGLENLTKHVDEKFAGVDEKFKKVDQKFAEQTSELKNYVHDSFEVQQVWMDERFKELITVYDVRERVSVLEKEVLQLKLSK